MSESKQRLVLFFGAAMVAMIGLLLALQLGFGALAEEEPQMINPRSLLFAALVAGGITFAFGPKER